MAFHDTFNDGDDSSDPSDSIEEQLERRVRIIEDTIVLMKIDPKLRYKYKDQDWFVYFTLNDIVNFLETESLSNLVNSGSTSVVDIQNYIFPYNIIAAKAQFCINMFLKYIKYSPTSKVRGSEVPTEKELDVFECISATGLLDFFLNTLSPGSSFYYEPFIVEGEANNTLLRIERLFYNNLVRMFYPDQYDAL